MNTLPTSYSIFLFAALLVISAAGCAAAEPAAPLETAPSLQTPVQTAQVTQPPTTIPTLPPEPSPTAPPGLEPGTLGNTTYNLDVVSSVLPDSGGKVTLKDGLFEQRNPDSTGAVSVNLINEARGDLNGDGLEDGVSVLAINTGGSGTFMNLAAVLNENGVPRHAATRFLGDRVKVQSLAVGDGAIHIQVVVHGPQDPACCPSQEVSEAYLLQGDLLVTPAQSQVLPLAETAIRALQAKDMAALSALVHPTAGLRFSPYSFVRPEHLVFTPEQLTTLLDDPTIYNWGIFDGSGAPIEMTFADYFARFVYSKDFAEAEQVSADQRLGGGNTIDNSQEFYPGAVVVEYHLPGENPEYGGMDWQSLRLVFQQIDGAWYLAGIIHDEWTT